MYFTISPNIRAMRKTLFIWIVLFTFSHIITSQEKELKEILNDLDAIVANNELYTLKKEARIEVLNNRKQVLPANSISLYDVNMQLYGEYKAYMCDSAIVYLNKNIQIAESLQDVERLIQSKLLLARLLEQSGLYIEATDVIESIDRKMLPDHFMIRYYNTYNNIYRSIEHYTQDNRLKEVYGKTAQIYRDSLILVKSANENATDEESLAIQELFYLDSANYKEALRINSIRLKKAKPGTAEHALVTYYRSLIEKNMGHFEMEKYYLALSALSDLQASIRDYASLWMLAEILYKEGDIDRAYKYIRFSWDDTQFYNARHRNLQTAGILSLIDQTYQKKIQEKNEKQYRYNILVTLLSVLLGIALLYIYRQMKKLSAARYNLQCVNNQLKELNEDLKVMNTDLLTSNDNLSESNMIKEKYIGRFINLCSVYIDKLDAYRRMVHKKILCGQIEQLKQITGSADSLDDELKELYTNFDTAFLQLFPDFVDKFNELLLNKERIILKKGELLNTELRIYALIRLGIDDSARIAEFLRYSLNTIYNYRAKVRNKAKGSRDDFEDLVKQIK